MIFSAKPNGDSQMLSGKESTCQCGRCKKHEFNPWIMKIPRRRKWGPTPVLLPGKFHGQRSLVGYSPWVGKESDVTEHAHTKPNGIWYINFSKVQVQFFQKVQVWKTSADVGGYKCKYIPKYFILSIVMVNGIFSLISLSVFSLLVYRNARVESEMLWVKTV